MRIECELTTARFGAICCPRHIRSAAFKARVFNAIGFDEDTVEAFVAELRRIASSGEASVIEDFPFGRKYTVPGDLKGAAGSVAVLTVWIVESAQEPKLVTVRPR